MSTLKDKAAVVEKRPNRKARREANQNAKRLGLPEPFRKAKAPPEPVIFCWMDWAKEKGNLLHCGRKKLKYRFSTFVAEIVGESKDGRVLVRVPLRQALIVFGKA